MKFSEGQVHSLDIQTSAPWVLAIITAAWFGFMAWRTKQGWVGWTIAGAVLGLVTSTIIMGLGHAAYIPMSNDEAHSFRMKTIFLSVVVIAVVGWLFTMGLHRHYLIVWRATKKLYSKQ